MKAGFNQMKKSLFVPLVVSLIGFASLSCDLVDRSSGEVFDRVRTIGNVESELIEPFGIAVVGNRVFVSDGEKDQILTIGPDNPTSVFARSLNTPSALAADKDGDLVVANTGSNTIKKISNDGTVITVAGSEGVIGSADGAAGEATFNRPVGVAVADGGKIFISDTYNDRIRVVENGRVTTLAGGKQDYADGVGVAAQFDTPLGIALWGERLLVADAGNRRIRVVEPDGRVWTLAGNGGTEILDGLPADASFVRPTAIAVSPGGVIYIADGNAIRAIGRRGFAFVETIAGGQRGFRDGNPLVSHFNRPSGLAFDDKGRLLVADSDNGLVRRFETVGNAEKKKEQISPKPKQYSAEEFRQLQPPRWPYDPPEVKRDVAGTLGEIRGEIVDENSQVWFHNGLDIAGGYGETARFVRAEKVLNPVSTDNFGNLRELIRMPLMGYIHIRLGRDSADKPFGDPRFIFSYGFDGKMNGVRVPRGAKFTAGEPIGTLNAMNHVHLIAGPSGAEMNALDALILPNVSDSIAPMIENVTLWDENWLQIETEKPGTRTTLTGKTRLVVRAFDRMDGNPERRRLGVYKLGYQLLKTDGSLVLEPNWTITFGQNPPFEAVKTVYATGSKSGATGETIFNYIVTNRLTAQGYGEGFLDPATLEPGSYKVRVFAADFFGNQTSKDIQIEVKR